MPCDKNGQQLKSVCVRVVLSNDPPCVKLALASWGGYSGLTFFVPSAFPVRSALSCQGVLASAEPWQARPALCGRSSSRLPSHTSPTVPPARANRLLPSRRPLHIVPLSHSASRAVSRAEWHGMLGDVVSGWQAVGCPRTPPRGYVYSGCPRTPP